MAHAVVLGTGTSFGIPMLGREYAPEYLANPKNHRTRSSIVFVGPSGNLLVDCTPEMRLQMTREKIYDIDAVLITHTHADHVMGMDDLRSIYAKTQRPVRVYALARYHADIRRIFPYAFVEPPQGVFAPSFDLQEAPDEMDVGGLTFRTFVVDHGSAPSVGVRCGNLAYITDVSEIPEAARRLLDGLDVLFLDAVRYKPHRNHFHFEKAIEVATEIGARKTYFTHLSHDYDHDITNASLPSGIELAWDGLRVEL